MTSTSPIICQNCGHTLEQTLVDLGDTALANSYVALDQAGSEDPAYPLHARFCDNCGLVQVEDAVPAAEIFTHYHYFSSFSDSWIAHVREYADAMTARFGLNSETEVIEIASNDGYLLQFFAQNDIPVLGVEPAENVAKAAVEKGVPTRVAFFGVETAKALREEGHSPRLIAAKNVLAHVPDINDFVGGLSVLMDNDTAFTVEFPHLLNLIEGVQFDTIYHEHYTYLSLLAIEGVFKKHGLRVFDVEEVSTHGGSLRVFACQEGAGFETQPGVTRVRNKELAAKLDRREGYQGFDEKVRAVKADLLAFLADAKAAGKRVAGYGAAAKGNTLLNYCGVMADDIAYAVDRNPMKQDTLLPGSHIPVFDVDKLEADPVDFVLILPWNIRDEVMAQLADLQARLGFKFVIAVPRLTIFDAAASRRADVA